MQACHIGVVCHARSTSNDVIAFAINTPDKSRYKKGKNGGSAVRAHEKDRSVRVYVQKREKEREKIEERERLCVLFPFREKLSTRDPRALKLQRVYRTAAHYVLFFHNFPSERKTKFCE